jgi:hypothetical protein
MAYADKKRGKIEKDWKHKTYIKNEKTPFVDF